MKILESVLDYTPSPLPPPSVETDPLSSNGSAETTSEAPPVSTEPQAETKQDGPQVDVNLANGTELAVSSDMSAKQQNETKADEGIEASTGNDQIAATLTAAPVPAPHAPVTLRERPTLVIATGDANSSEYNPGGFLGCVRRALDRGWDVEIASFSTHGLSSLWAGEKAKKVTEDGRARGELRIVNLETFAEELVM